MICYLLYTQSITSTTVAIVSGYSTVIITVVLDTIIINVHRLTVHMICYACTSESTAIYSHIYIARRIRLTTIMHDMRVISFCLGLLACFAQSNVVVSLGKFVFILL